MSYWDKIHKNLDKNLDESHEILKPLHTVQKNSQTQLLQQNENQIENNENKTFSYDDLGKQRKLESLFGYNVPRPREEWIEIEQENQDTPETETEKWEKKRNDLKEYSERDRAVAYKRDELAEVDEEGYRYEPESPAFRDGYNNTLRIKPPVNPDLHNGSEINIQGKALETYFSKQKVTSIPSEKPLQSVEILKHSPQQQPTVELKVLTPLIKTVRKNKNDIKIKELFKSQSNIEVFIPNTNGVKKTLLKRDFYSKTLASFVLKALYTENNFGLDLTPDEKQELKSKFKNGEIELEELGKVFVELGFVLAPELRDESKKHEFDLKSLKIGQKILYTELQGKSTEQPILEETVKQDLALALGRVMNNLKSLILVENVTLKNEFQHEQHCITPIPFILSEQTHPVTKSPSELVVGIQRIPDQITPENLFRPIEAVPTPANIMEIIETPFSGEYSPKQHDTLFWCIYIIANGYGEYINIDRNYGLKELEIKKQIGECTANKGYLKSTPNYKITNNLRGEIHSELLTSQKDTSFPCLLILCCYYKINVVLLHPNGKLMLEFISNTDAETSYYILKKNIHGKYSVNTDKKTWKDVQEMKTKLVCIGNYMKPIKAAGNYKIEDLEEFAEKLGVLDATKKYKKVELYQLVQEHMNFGGTKGSLS
jgi:hypothetical protein